MTDPLDAIAIRRAVSAARRAFPDADLDDLTIFAERCIEHEAPGGVSKSALFDLIAAAIVALSLRSAENAIKAKLDDPTTMNRDRIAAYADMERDAERHREIADKCRQFGLPHRRIGFIERGIDAAQARSELHRDAFREAEPPFVPFALLILDPTFSAVDYSAHDAELARIEARKTEQ